MKLSKKAATNLIALTYGKGLSLEEALEHEKLKGITEEELRATVATLYKIPVKKETATQSRNRDCAEMIAASIGVGNTFSGDTIVKAAKAAGVKSMGVTNTGKRCGLWERIPSMGKALYKVLATA